mmetsp:Transcript_8717/g.35549  ORF Transcript_8717/g.35549 Transcript_8717/m.35549 type:complete len:359 (-) Transcript_8717:1143-2219(-)
MVEASAAKHPRASRSPPLDKVALEAGACSLRHHGLGCVGPRTCTSAPVLIRVAARATSHAGGSSKCMYMCMWVISCTNAVTLSAREGAALCFANTSSPSMVRSSEDTRSIIALATRSLSSADAACHAMSRASAMVWDGTHVASSREPSRATARLEARTRARSTPADASVPASATAHTTNAASQSVWSVPCAQVVTMPSRRASSAPAARDAEHNRPSARRRSADAPAMSSRRSTGTITFMPSATRGTRPAHSASAVRAIVAAVATLVSSSSLLESPRALHSARAMDVARASRGAIARSACAASRMASLARSPSVVGAAMTPSGHGMDAPPTSSPVVALPSRSLYNSSVTCSSARATAGK